MIEVETSSKLVHTKWSQELALKRLGYLHTVTPVAAATWKEKVKRWVPTGPFGTQQFREVEIEMSLDDVVKRKLIGKAIFSLWSELRDAGKKQEADQVIVSQGSIPKQINSPVA